MLKGNVKLGLREASARPPSEGPSGTMPVQPIWYSRRRLRPTPVFATYWRYACQRQEIFYRRLLGQGPPWTDDPILQSHRFTNVYRASDRVTQYLIGKVIPGSRRSVSDVFFRTILFKIFNRVSTWEQLQSAVGEPHADDFDVDRYDEVLTKVRAAGERLYSAAYIMPSPQLGHPRKHTNHLKLLQHMLDQELPERLTDVRSMREAYEMLLHYPSLGRFLAFQYLIDLNYSDILNFDEMEFVVAGPGAVNGISKCFYDTAGFSTDEVIRATAEVAEREFERHELPFLTLWSRPLQLIDCQNLYCEVDKYSRKAHPDFQGVSGRRRIKQGYRHDPLPIRLSFPAKWKLQPRLDWPPLARLCGHRPPDVLANRVTLRGSTRVVAQPSRVQTLGGQGLLPIFNSWDPNVHGIR